VQGAKTPPAETGDTASAAALPFGAVIEQLVFLKAPLVNAGSPGGQHIGRAQTIYVILFALLLTYTRVSSERTGVGATQATGRRTMANLLKIGAKVINLDLVTDMVVTMEEIIVYLSAPAGRRDQSQSRMLRFSGAEADRLRAWLNVHTTELAPAPERVPEEGLHVAEVVGHSAPARRSTDLGGLLRAAGGTGRALHRSLFNRILS
jgi:hypothetical protein